jgi:hypothetical protein
VFTDVGFVEVASLKRGQRMKKYGGYIWSTKSADEKHKVILVEAETEEQAKAKIQTIIHRIGADEWFLDSIVEDPKLVPDDELVEETE